MIGLFCPLYSRMGSKLCLTEGSPSLLRSFLPGEWKLSEQQGREGESCGDLQSGELVRVDLEARLKELLRLSKC